MTAGRNLKFQIEMTAGRNLKFQIDDRGEFHQIKFDNENLVFHHTPKIFM